MFERLAILLENLASVVISEEILRRGGAFVVVPEPKIGKSRRKIYKKKKDGGLYTLGTYPIEDTSDPKSVEAARKRAKKRLGQIEFFKHRKR